MFSQLYADVETHAVVFITGSSLLVVTEFALALCYEYGYGTHRVTAEAQLIAHLIHAHAHIKVQLQKASYVCTGLEGGAGAV